MIKAAVFDIDGTLAPIGKPISRVNVELLKKLERQGVFIVMSSGKPTYYQIGMFRQVGLKNPAFIGENGCSIAVGVGLPPETIDVVRPDDSYFITRKKIFDDVTALCGKNVWLQPNDVMLTFFFKTDGTAATIREYFKSNAYTDVNVYEHVDSFDIVPKSADKYIGLDVLAKHFSLSPDEIVTVGDGVNDLPMFKYGKYSISIDNKALNATYDLKSITDALKLIYDRRKEW